MAVHEHILGPPGTGKTSTLIGRHVNGTMVPGRFGRLLRDGVEPDRIVLTAFNRLAANELIDRALALSELDSRDRPALWNTLHGIGLHLIRTEHGRQVEVADPGSNSEARGFYREFCDAHHITFRIGGHGGYDDDEEIAAQDEGHLLFAYWQMRRDMLLDAEHAYHAFLHRLSPRTEAPSRARCEWFANAWELWKRTHGLVDYSDMLIALDETEWIPNADWLLLDEAQDLGPREQRIVQRWIEHLPTILAYDEDQLIYGFKGASYSWLARLPGPRTTLEQSHRCPRAVANAALAIIARNRDRYPKTWRPRPEEGRFLHDNLYSAMHMAMSNGDTYFLLARDNLTVRDLTGHLLDLGIPYRHRNGADPLSTLRADGPARAALELALGQPVPLRTAARLADARTHPQWWLPTARDVLRQAARSDPDRLIDRSDMARFLTTEGLSSLNMPSVALLHWAGMEAWRVRYVLRCLRRYGPSAVFAEPRITAGTIHSVKGLEADHVVLCPDLQRRSFESAELDPEAERRLGYVAYTRARRTLTRLHAETGLESTWW